MQLPGFFYFFSKTFSEVLVIEDFETAVGHQTLGYTDAFFRLVVLDDGGHDTGQRQCRTVQGMAEFCLLGLGVAVAALQAVGLVALEVGYRRHLQPALLGGAPYLEVIADGRGETHVAAAET